MGKILHSESSFNWICINTWKKSSYNTLWCLLGCSIGDFGTILFFQYSDFQINTFIIMTLAIINGIITSILLETIILLKQMNFYRALNTAFGMSFISMITMELVMNITDYLITGGAFIYLWIIPIMLFFGFFSALPYNYWRLKRYEISCH